MLRVFDPRAQLTPVQVSESPHNTVKTPGNWEIKCSYPTENLERTGIFVTLFMLPFTVLFSPLHPVINMLTATQLAHHWPLTAVHLLLIYGCATQAAISAPLFPRVPIPH